MTSYRHQNEILNSDVTLSSSRFGQDGRRCGWPGRKLGTTNRPYAASMTVITAVLLAAGGGSAVCGLDSQIVGESRRQARVSQVARQCDGRRIRPGRGRHRRRGAADRRPEGTHRAQPEVATGPGRIPSIGHRGRQRFTTAISSSSASPISHSSRPRHGALSLPLRRRPDRRCHVRRCPWPNPVRLLRSVWPHLPLRATKGPDP